MLHARAVSAFTGELMAVRLQNQGKCKIGSSRIETFVMSYDNDIGPIHQNKATALGNFIKPEML